MDDPDIPQVVHSVEHLARHGLEHISWHADEQGIHAVVVQVLPQDLSDNHVMTSEAEALIVLQQVVRIGILLIHDLKHEFFFA